MPKWTDLKRFCEQDCWELYKEKNYLFYRKSDENGIIRHTVVHREDRDIPAMLWNKILTKQLCVSEEYFKSKL